MPLSSSVHKTGLPCFLHVPPPAEAISPTLGERMREKFPLSCKGEVLTMEQWLLQTRALGLPHTRVCC